VGLLSQEKSATIYSVYSSSNRDPFSRRYNTTCVMHDQYDDRLTVTLVALEHHLPSTLYCLMIEAGVHASCVSNLSVKHSEMLTPVSAELSR